MDLSPGFELQTVLQKSGTICLHAFATVAGQALAAQLDRLATPLLRHKQQNSGAVCLIFNATARGTVAKALALSLDRFVRLPASIFCSGLACTVVGMKLLDPFVLVHTQA